jgi:hypothetical protein
VLFNPKDIVSGDFYWATKKDNKFYTNKGNLFGNKLKNLKGEKLNLTADQLNKIENAVIKRIQKGMTYRQIIKLFEKKNLKLSLGYIYLLNKNQTSVESL